MMHGPIPLSNANVAKTYKTNVELGGIMLDASGAEACQSGYGTTDPYEVGQAALMYGDINLDGSLN